VTSEKAIGPLNLERLWREKEQGTEVITTPEQQKREKDLALSADV
jgi:hypothetical protein